MKITTRLTTLAWFALIGAGPVFASDIDDLTALLHEFLAASGEKQAHERFWAAGRVFYRWRP